MNILKKFLEGKGWLLYGSLVGGILGALAMHLNAVLSPGGALLAGMPLGFPEAIGLGMIGGLGGGAIGSFLAGMAAREEIVFNIGASLGIGLINGFMIGVVVGVIMGGLHNWHPNLTSPSALMIFFAIVVAVAAVVYLVMKKRRGR